MKTPILRCVAGLALSALFALFAGPVLAEGRGEGAHSGRAGVALAAPYVQECGACHVAYPPALLGAAAWQRQMNGLPRHYGSDASLDAATAATIAKWLQANAGEGRRVEAAPAEDRISRSAWFQREHREVGRDTWQRVKSASQCQACHTRAADGSYREDEIHIPNR